MFLSINLFLKLISDFSEKSFNNFLSVVKVSKLNSGDGGDELVGGYEKIHFSLKKSLFPLFFVKLFYKLLPPKYGTGGNLHLISPSPEIATL